VFSYKKLIIVGFIGEFWWNWGFWGGLVEKDELFTFLQSANKGRVRGEIRGGKGLSFHIIE
jgi:hypothetical protein